MSFFQNPFAAEFRGNWVLGDRHQSPTFICPANTGRGAELVKSYGTAPYNLSGNDADGNAKSLLNINFALDGDLFKNWASISVDMTTSTGTVTTAVTIDRAVASLNADTKFASYFTATATSDGILIKQKLAVGRFRFYILNSQAETVLLFNKFAGVAELPTYFSRHSVTNRFAYDDAQNCIVELNTAFGVDSAVINNAVDNKGKTKGFVSTTVKTDAELLEGRSGLFLFQKITVDSSDRITEIIEYHAGAGVGDLSKKTTYTYTTTNKNPSTMKQIPYTLTSGDLLP